MCCVWCRGLWLGVGVKRWSNPVFGFRKGWWTRRTLYGFHSIWLFFDFCLLLLKLAVRLVCTLCYGGTRALTRLRLFELLYVTKARGSSVLFGLGGSDTVVSDHQFSTLSWSFHTEGMRPFQSMKAKEDRRPNGTVVSPILGWGHCWTRTVRINGNPREALIALISCLNGSVIYWLIWPDDRLIVNIWQAISSYIDLGGKVFYSFWRRLRYLTINLLHMLDLSSSQRLDVLVLLSRNRRYSRTTWGYGGRTKRILYMDWLWMGSGKAEVVVRRVVVFCLRYEWS